MKKTIIYLIMFVCLFQLVQAGELFNNTYFNPSESNIIFYINKTLHNVVNISGNETCITINTTNYCTLTNNDWLQSTEIIILGIFNFTISDVGIEWIRLNWSDSSVQAQYSYDNSTWTNVSIITSTGGIQYALPQGTLIYLRAKSISTEYYYESDKTKEGLDSMGISLVIGIGIISALFLWLAFRLDEGHFILKLLLTLSSITLLILIPASIFITDTANLGKIFYRTFLYIFIAFWLYVFLYFCYWILQKLGWIVSGEEEDE